MRKIQRLAAIGVMAALTVSVGACSADQEPAAAPTTTPAAEPAAPTSESPAASDGVTQTSDIAGPACSQVDTTGEGSAEGMVDDPVATAASNNKLLSTLVTAVGAAELGDTLNSPEATLTVFAPINSAFEALEAQNPGITEELTTAPDVAEPTGTLYKVLTTHVVGTRYDADGLQSAGTVPSMQPGSQLTIGGTAPDALTVSSGGVTANVVCANIPTANATVFLIDKVMMPAAS